MINCCDYKYNFSNNDFQNITYNIQKKLNSKAFHR